MENTSLADRLRKCAELVGSGDELARRSGIPRSTLETYFTGKTEPKADRLAEICYLCGVDGHWLLTGRGAMMVQSTRASAAPADASACMEMAILAVEHGIAAHAVPLDPQRRTALTMLAYEQVQSGKQGTALEAFVRHLLTLVALPLSREENELIDVFRNATEAQRFLITRHVSIGTPPVDASQDAKLA